MLRGLLDRIFHRPVQKLDQAYLRHFQDDFKEGSVTDIQLWQNLYDPYGPAWQRQQAERSRRETERTRQKHRDDAKVRKMTEDLLRSRGDHYSIHDLLATRLEECMGEPNQTNLDPNLLNLIRQDTPPWWYRTAGLRDVERLAKTTDTPWKYKTPEPTGRVLVVYRVEWSDGKVSYYESSDTATEAAQQRVYTLRKRHPGMTYQITRFVGSEGVPYVGY